MYYIRPGVATPLELELHAENALGYVPSININA